ncbi:MAG: hypothetical protein K2M00_08575 [Muribaculaceae bacterium]|nr:hypothetical protein [Muribaculaceae bacterium]
MKQFIIKLSIFALIIVACDFALGYVFRLYDYTKGGTIHKIHALMTRETPGVLVLGSSRAAHHYVTSALSDSLNLKAYNGGVDGQGVPIAYALFKGVNQRVTPSIIICDLHPSFDLNDDSYPSLNSLYPYTLVDSVENIITSFDPQESIKMISNSYRLNSALFRLIPSVLLSGSDSRKGYDPLFRKLETNIYSDDTTQVAVVPDINPTKEKWLRALITESGDAGSKLIFTISPVLGGGDLDYYKKELAIINEYDIPVFNYLNDRRFIDTPQFFNDKTHLNNAGAEIFTNVVISDIKATFLSSDNR